MAYEEYTVEKNTGYVPLAQKDTPEGVLQDIERRALAEVTSAEKTSNKGEQAQKAAAGATGTEGKVYADMAMEAAGFKSVSTLVSAVGARLNDTSSIQGVTENTATASRHIDDDIKSAGRAPGSYRNPHEARGYGIQQVAGGSDLSNMSLGDRAGLTSASLRAEEGTGNLSTWAKKPFESAKVPGLDGQVKALELQNNAKLSQDVTFTKEAASEAALTSVKLARDHQSTLRGPQGPGMAGPGMGGPMGGLNFDLSQGPRFNHAQYEESAGRS